MHKIEPIKLDKETTDGTVRNLDALYQLFPSCFTEAPDALGKVHRAVDWGKLRSLLGERSTTLLGLANGLLSARRQHLVARRCALARKRA